MQRVRLALVCLLALAPAVTAWGQAGQLRPNYLIQQRWLRIMVLDGRLAVAAVSEGQTTVNVNKVHQHFGVSLTAGGAVLDYDSTSPSEKLLIHIQGDDQATLRHEFSESAGDKTGNGNSTATGPITVEYTQGAKQPVKLTVTQNGETRSVEGASLWHLLMFEPELSDRYLVPILEMLRPDWRLAATADELKQSLVHAAMSNRSGNRAKWSELVAQLADSHYATRQRAERELRSAGRGVLPYLQSLKRSDLDAEQWQRISEIISASSDDREDTPERTALRFLDDRSVWIGLMADSQQSTRRTAADRLGELVGATIDFDPAASPEVRSKQLAQLREKYLPPR